MSDKPHIRRHRGWWSPAGNADVPWDDWNAARRWCDDNLNGCGHCRERMVSHPTTLVCAGCPVAHRDRLARETVVDEPEAP